MRAGGSRLHLAALGAVLAVGATGYYAGRDISYNPVFRPAELERRLAGARQRPFVFLLSEDEQGKAELRPSLAAHYGGQPAELLGQRYLIFHIPGARDST